MQKVVLFSLCFSSPLSFSQQRMNSSSFGNQSQQVFYSMNNMGRLNPASQNTQNTQMSNVSVARPANNLNKRSEIPQAQIQNINNNN